MRDENLQDWRGSLGGCLQRFCGDQTPILCRGDVNCAKATSERRESSLATCPKERELICPGCRTSETRVVDSRDDATSVRRRRECLHCRQRFTTYERIEVARLYVVKKDGRREQFSRDKLLNGLRRACEKRPIADAQLLALVTEIVQLLLVRGESEVPAEVIGENLMQALRELDTVAYIRFASVYRAFHDAESFRAELAALLAQ